MSYPSWGLHGIARATLAVLATSVFSSAYADGVFASVDMDRALKLRKDGRAVNVVMFTRNRCARLPDRIWA